MLRKAERTGDLRSLAEIIRVARPEPRAMGVAVGRATTPFAALRDVPPIAYRLLLAGHRFLPGGQTDDQPLEDQTRGQRTGALEIQIGLE